MSTMSTISNLTPFSHILLYHNSYQLILMISKNYNSICAHSQFSHALPLVVSWLNRYMCHWFNVHLKTQESVKWRRLVRANLPPHHIKRRGGQQTENCITTDAFLFATKASHHITPIVHSHVRKEREMPIQGSIFQKQL